MPRKPRPKDLFDQELCIGDLIVWAEDCIDTSTSFVLHQATLAWGIIVDMGEDFVHASDQVEVACIRDFDVVARVFSVTQRTKIREWMDKNGANPQA